MQDNAGANYYATLDNVGSVLLLIDGSQTTAAAYTYDPYGVTLTNTGTGGVNTTNHYRYATGYTDPTGLIKLGARYYNPQLGRFTQPDPSGQETNRYAYAADNPSTFNDRSGTNTAYSIGDAGILAVTLTFDTNTSTDYLTISILNSSFPIYLASFMYSSDESLSLYWDVEGYDGATDVSLSQFVPSDGFNVVCVNAEAFGFWPWDYSSSPTTCVDDS